MTELLSVVARAIEHAANVDGATASPLLNEEARNLAMAVMPVIEQVCATLGEDLRKTKDERDRLLPFVIQKCLQCGAVTAPAFGPEELLALTLKAETEETGRWRLS